MTRDNVKVVAETADWLTYDLPHDIVPRIWKGRFRGQKQKWFLLRFQGDNDNINIDTAHPEFSEWRWIGPEQMIAEIVPFKREIYANVVKEFEDYL